MWPNAQDDPALIDERVLIMASSKKMVLVFIASLLGVLVSVWMAFIQEAKVVMSTVGIVSTAVFGITMLYALFRLVKPKPAVIVDAEGFRDQATTFAGRKLVRWTDVEEVFLYDYMGQHYLGVRLHDAESYINAQPAWKRAMIQANINLVNAPINIPQSAVNVYLEQLLSMMQRRWNKANRAGKQGNG